MEKKIDIIPFLTEIVEKNTHHYQSDLAHDERRLQEAMLEMYQENRTFLWMSRPCGTHCVLEREAFLRETGAHDIWTHYEYDAEHIKAFRIIVAPGYKGAFVLGAVKPLDYGEQVQRVKQKAIHVQTVEMTFEDRETCAMSYDDYRKQINTLLAVHGDLLDIIYRPENEYELSAVLSTERTISAAKKRSSRKKNPPTR